MDLVKIIYFDAAHKLPNVPVGHKCNRLHGHTFRVDIAVSGPEGTESGWVVDFADIQQAFLPLLDQLDHNYLNEVDGLDNPTSENIARWIWVRLKPLLPSLVKVSVFESPDSGCFYCGEDE